MNEYLYQKAVELLEFIKRSDEYLSANTSTLGDLIVPINDKRVDIYMCDDSISFASLLFNKTKFENDNDPTRLMELITDDNKSSLAKATDELIRMNHEYNYVKFIESHKDDLDSNPYWKRIVDQCKLYYKVSLVE